MDGDHDIDGATSRVPTNCGMQRRAEGMVLKPNMAISGKKCAASSVESVSSFTIRLRHSSGVQRRRRIHRHVLLGRLFWGLTCLTAAYAAGLAGTENVAAGEQFSQARMNGRSR